MKELDFTGMNQLAYKGFETAEEQETRDSLLQAGYTFVDPSDNPFTAPQASAPATPPAPIRGAAAPPPQTSAGKGDPFTDHTGSRNYKSLYRIAHDFHQRHNPPTVRRDYWQDHRPGEDEPPEEELRYWTETAADISKTSAAGGDDPFLAGLLTMILEELEREYKALREDACRSR